MMNANPIVGDMLLQSHNLVDNHKNRPAGVSSKYTPILEQYREQSDDQRQNAYLKSWIRSNVGSTSVSFDPHQAKSRQGNQEQQSQYQSS